MAVEWEITDEKWGRHPTTSSAGTTSVARGPRTSRFKIVAEDLSPAFSVQIDKIMSGAGLADTNPEYTNAIAA